MAENMENSKNAFRLQAQLSAGSQSESLRGAGARVCGRGSAGDLGPPGAGLQSLVRELPL